MSALRSVLQGVLQFVVGDDWRIALGIVIALAVTALVATSALAAWWVLPLAVLAVLGDSLRRAARSARR
ncbi:MAG: hypothetical protein ABSD82_09165 [Solirubrobacteraceae bacterium]